jgi:aspartate-semialdehyde dehydrogenase
MSGSERVWRVAFEGASSLLGKEILAVLKARGFPVSHVIGLESRTDVPEAPILDIADDAIPVVPESAGQSAEYDFVFRAGRSSLSVETPEPAERPDGAAGAEGSKAGFVIDMSGSSAPRSLTLLPLFSSADQDLEAAFEKGVRHFVCPHAVTCVLAALGLRLSASIEIRQTSALFFLSASELGPDAIEELQKQTVGLLNFGDIPRKVFGTQIAFNLSPRLGGKAKNSLVAAEARIQGELEHLLARHAPVPAVRLVQSPSFYSMAFSIYVQSPVRATASQIQQALSGNNVRWVRVTQPSATPAEVQGSATLLLDPIVEAGQPGGFWVWGRVDDLRLQAENAVAIAEHLMPFINRQ